MSFFYFLQKERNTNNHFVDRPVSFYEKPQKLSNLPSYKCNRKGPKNILRNMACQHASRVDVALTKNLGSLKKIHSHKAKVFVVLEKNKQKLTAIENAKKCFWNQTFDKGRLKNFVLWFFLKYGEHKTVRLVEELKTIGFQYATKAGISLGVEDLKIPPKKAALIYEAEKLSLSTIRQFKRGEITEVERFQRLIDTWHRTSEQLKIEVIENFEGTDVLNPVYMMAFSGARGNISQVRQLVGMRGLMSNPQGQIIDFPIRSNFREGLTLTEYIISSYGARKGIVDTALRTANAGYLTRRLVDVAQHVIISTTDCGTTRGIFLNDMKEGNKTIYSLQNRLVGRVLARDVYNNQNIKIASKNMEISGDLAILIAQHHKKIFVRSPLTCQTNKLVCQLCYGWSLAQGNLVSIGEAVGIVAAQSIGEPGTQLTMRTFHTGGVFSGNVSDQIKAPFDGFVVYNNPIAGKLIRTPEGKIAFLTKDEGSFSVYRFSKPKRRGDRIDQNTGSTKAGGFDPSKDPDVPNDINLEALEKRNFKIPFYTLLFLRNREKVFNKQVIAQISSINRQKTATDQAELTIKAEISGLFYSKNLEIEETRSGPSIKENTTSGTTKKQSTANTSLVTGRRRIPKKDLAPQADQSTLHFASESQRLQSIVPPDELQEESEDNLLREFDIVDQSLVDIINKAWNWGYAWILSGKIYQLPFPSNFFPIFGDFVTKKTYMNCINWYLPSTFGSGFKINRPLTYSVFNQKTIKKMRQTLFSKEEFNLSPRTDKLIGTFYQSKNLNKTQTSLLEKDFKLLKYDLISFELSNILYKKMGYFLNLSQASHTSTKYHLQDNQESKTFLINVNQNFPGANPPIGFPLSPLKSINPHPELCVEREVQVYHPRKAVISADAKTAVLESSFLENSKQSLEMPQRSILSLNDTLFLYSGLFPKNRYFADIKTEKSLKINNNKPLINPTNWEPSFSIFLNWFPKRFFTKTAGILFLELFSPTNKKITIKPEPRSDTINIFNNSIGSFLTPSNSGAGAFTNQSRKGNKYKSQSLRLTSMLPSRTSRVTGSSSLQRAERVEGDKHIESLDKTPLDFTINFSSRINTKIDELHPSSTNTSSIERALSLKRLFPRNKATDKTNKVNKLNNLVKTSLQKYFKKSSIINPRIATTVPTFFKNELLIIRPTERHIGNPFSFAKKSTTPVLDSFDNVGSSVGELGVPKRPFLSTNSQLLELPQSETSTEVNSPLEKEKSFTLTGLRKYAERVDVALINKQTIGELAQTLVHPKFTHSVRGHSMTTKNADVLSKVSSNIEISPSDGRRQSIKTKGLFWKNLFKYNWSGPLQQKANRRYINTQSVLTRSQQNNTIISSQRVFWVSQPFYKIHDKNNSIFINFVENFDGLQSDPEPTTLLGPLFKGSKINQHNSKPSHNGVFSFIENTAHLQKSVPVKRIKNSNDNSPALVLSQINRQGQLHFNSFDPNIVQISQINTTLNSQWPIDCERRTFVEASTLNKTTSFDFSTSSGSGHNDKNKVFPDIIQNQSSKRNEFIDCRYIKLTKGQLIGRIIYKKREFDKNQTNIQTRSLLCKKNNLVAHSVNTVNKNCFVDLKTFCRVNSPVDQYITSPAPFLLAKKTDLIINKKLNLVIDSFLGMKSLNLSRKRLPSKSSREMGSSGLQRAVRVETNSISSLQVQDQKHKRIKKYELALFDFYFYSLFNKQFNKTQPKGESMPQAYRSKLGVKQEVLDGGFVHDAQSALTAPILQVRNNKNSKNKENNYKHICSPYLKEQFSKYLPNISPIIKTKNRLIWSSYNNNSIQYHLFSEKNRQMFQRVNYLRHWFKKRNILASMRVGQQLNTLRQKKRNNIKRLSLQSTVKQNETESNSENFLNIWLKNGWFYYTTDLTQFFLNHKKLLPAGKNFDSHFIFDRDNIYIEILPLNQLPSLKTFVIDSLSSVDRLKKVTSKSDSSTSDRSLTEPKEVSFYNAQQDPSVTGLLTQGQQMPLKKQALQSVLVKHDLAETKTLPRRRISNTKQSLFIKQQSWLTFIEKRTENLLVTVTSTLNKKTEESTETLKHLKFKKVLINKKCRFNFNINTNNTNKSNSIEALPVIEPKQDNASKSSNNEPVTENTTNTSTTNNLLFKNQTKAPATRTESCQKNSYILLICKANEIPFFKEIEAKKEIYELSKQQKQPSNLYNLNKYQTYMLSPERHVVQIDENQTLNSSSFSNKNRNKNFSLCAKFRSSLLIRTKNILKMRSNQSKTKLLNKVYNTSRLYTEYKTGIFNKQTITPQILSKYPSSELKIISNNSFSSFLSENEIDRQSNNVTEHTSKSLENSLTFKNNTNILSTLNKEHSAVLPTLMVTCLKTFNLAPFILSYKAPYSVNFPFKTPMCFFSEQYKPTKFFKKPLDSNSQGSQILDVVSKGFWQQDKLLNNKKLEQNEKSKKVESTLFKKVISTYLLKIDLLHSSELNIAPKKIKAGQNCNKTQNSPINGAFSRVVNRGPMAQALQSKSSRTASRLEAFFHSGPKGKTASELRASREVQVYHRKIANTFSNLASMFFVPIAEYSLLNDFPKSIGSLNGDVIAVPTKQTLATQANKLTNSSAMDNKKYLFGLHNNISLLSSLGTSHGYVNTQSVLTTRKNVFGNVKQKNQWTSNILASKSGPLFKGQSSLFAFGGDSELLRNKNKLYSIHFVSYINNSVNSQNPCIKTYAHSSVNGELIYRKKNLKPIDLESPLIYNELMTLKKSIPDLSIKKILRQKLTDYFLSNKKVDHIDHSCMILTKSDQISYSFGDSSQTYKNIYLNLEKLKTKNIYFINKMAINVLNLLANPADNYNSKTTEDFTKYELHELFSGPIDFSNHNQSFVSDEQKALITANSGVLELNNLPAGIAQQTSKLLVGEFLVYGDKIHPDFAISKSGQIIHINKHKITLRKGQPIFVSPQAILHKYDGDFVDEQTSVITLAYQQLKTGDIVQGIPKIEQFFEARTTKRGRLFRDSLENLLKALFNRYVLKLPREQAVRQSFYKIQQIIIDGVQRVYRSQGVTIADKHLEVIVKQMTSKVRITFGGSTGYLPGEICDLYDIELLNKDIRPKILYEPIVLGITKASLEVKSFLSAASFQQTTRVLTKSALSRKNDYLNGLKENVILGNLIPAGTGYLVYLDGDAGSMTPLKELA